MIALAYMVAVAVALAFAVREVVRLDAAAEAERCRPAAPARDDAEADALVQRLLAELDIEVEAGIRPPYRSDV